VPIDPLATSPDRRDERGATVVEMVVVAVLVVTIGLVVVVATGRIQRSGSAVDCRNELRDVKVAVMNYESLTGQAPASTAELLRREDPLRGGRVLDDRPEHYEVGADGEITRDDGAPSTCPDP
jgi:competence protein ComGC